MKGRRGRKYNYERRVMVEQPLTVDLFRLVEDPGEKFEGDLPRVLGVVDLSDTTLKDAVAVETEPKMKANLFKTKQLSVSKKIVRSPENNAQVTNPEKPAAEPANDSAFRIWESLLFMAIGTIFTTDICYSPWRSTMSEVPEGIYEPVGWNIVDYVTVAELVLIAIVWCLAAILYYRCKTAGRAPQVKKDTNISTKKIN